MFFNNPNSYSENDIQVITQVIMKIIKYLVNNLSNNSVSYYSLSYLQFLLLYLFFLMKYCDLIKHS